MRVHSFFVPRSLRRFPTCRFRAAGTADSRRFCCGRAVQTSEQTFPGPGHQIAFWKPARISGYSRIDITAASIFDFYEHVFTRADEQDYRVEADNGLKPGTRYATWRTYKISDHLPMWVELRTDFSEEYLEIIEDS